MVMYRLNVQVTSASRFLNSASAAIASEKCSISLIGSRQCAFHRAIDEPCALPLNPPSVYLEILAELYHRLRGSASPVLTATGFVNGKGQFSTPTESTPLNRSRKNLSQVITPVTPTAVPN